MIQQGYKQQYGGCECERWVRKREQNSGYLERNRRKSDNHGKHEFSDALADQPDHRDQVVQIIQELCETFHS